LKPEIRKTIDKMAAAASEQRDQILQAGNSDPDADDWLAVLASLGRREVQLRKFASRVAHQLGLPRGAKPRILTYLRGRVGVVVDKDELSGVSGIYEWARRIRELRVEEGWPISSDQTRDDLGPGQYILESPEPDLDLRQRWQTANTIRRMKGSAGSRLLAYFQANIGKTISKDEVRYVSKIHAGPRRVRELEEAGWQIESHLDRTQLRPGEYVMVVGGQLPAKAREHIKLRFEILTRDGFRCTTCAAEAGAGRRLQVHHILPVEVGGTNVPANLETLCDACHAGKHAMNATDVRDEVLYPEAERKLAG